MLKLYVHYPRVCRQLCCDSLRRIFKLHKRISPASHICFGPAMLSTLASLEGVRHLCQMLNNVNPSVISYVLSYAATAHASLLNVVSRLQSRISDLENRSSEQDSRISDLESRSSEQASRISDLASRISELMEDKRQRDSRICSGALAAQVDRVACFAIYRNDAYRLGTTIGRLIKSYQNTSGDYCGFAKPEHFYHYAFFDNYLKRRHGLSMAALKILTKQLRVGRIEDAHQAKCEGISAAQLVDWADATNVQCGEDVRRLLEVVSPFALTHATAEERELVLRKELTNCIRVASVVDDVVSPAAIREAGV